MRKDRLSVLLVLRNALGLFAIPFFSLSFLAATPAGKRLGHFSAGKVQRLASEENLPLITARNSLSNLFADERPELQPGFANAVDVWLLYVPEFDRLSGNLQSYLLQKYGLDIPRSSLSDDGRKINNPAIDLRSRLQSETSSATSGSNIVVGYNDGSLGGFGSSISYSNDGGRTWNETFPPLYPFGSGLGDPVMAAGPGGVFYHAFLAVNGLGLSTVGVTKSANGGASWSPLVNATQMHTTSLDSVDKPWLAVDNTGSQYRGNVYVTWTRFTSERGASSGIGFVRSTDGGETWSQFQLIGQPADARGFVQGSMIAVGPVGEVYVAYFDTRIPGIAVVKSTDGGQTFGQPVTAFKDPSIRFSRNLSGGFETNSFPSIAADAGGGPNRGNIYVVANVKPSDSRDESDVIVVKSADGGATWSAPVRVNDDQTDTDQFQPSTAVAPDGTVGVMWYDRRNDPGNDVLLDVYMAASKDGGVTFSTNRRVTNANWMLIPTPFNFRTAYHGDYNQMSAGDLGFVLTWADDRSGTDSDIEAAVVSPPEALNQTADFILAAKTLTQNVLAGAAAHFTIRSIAIGTFDGAISLDASPAYPGWRFAFSSKSTKAPSEATVTVETAPLAKPGTYPVTIIGTFGNLTRTTTLRITISNPMEMGQVPHPVSDVRDSVFQPKAVVDSEGDLHVVSGGDSGRFFSPFGTITYSRYRAGTRVTSTVIARDPSVNLLSHTIGIDDSGAITVVWRGINPDSSVSNVFMSRSVDGGATFSRPANVTEITDARLSVSAPVLAVSRSGAIHIAYVLFDPIGGFQDVFFTKSSDGGATFPLRVNVSKSPLRFPSALASSPAIAVDSSGTVLIAFFAATGSRPPDIYFSQSADGSTFSTPLSVARASSVTVNPPSVSSPSLAVDRSGHVLVAFIRSDLTRNEQDVYFSRSIDGGITFSEPINASRTSLRGIRSFVPYVLADSAGNVGLAWGVFGPGPLFPGGRDVYFIKSTDGGLTFSTAINVSNDLGQQVTFPIVLTDADGQLSVLWEDETGGNNQIWQVTPGNPIGTLLLNRRRP
ncbi:MAG TPA: sialidase family protein [Acidobacteriota bacterium]